ncbi:MAG: HAD-IA family hydrolase [Pseudomonadota bacterium]
MAKKLVLLGSIGVLAETSDIQRQAYNQALDEAGLTWRWNRETYGALLNHTGGQDRLQLLSDATGAGLTADKIASIHARKTQIACAHLRETGVDLRPGVATLIAQCLENGIALGLVTTTYQENIDAIADAAGASLALSRFDIIVSRADVAAGKPDPAAYIHALRHTGIAAADTIALEDTSASILSARQAGLPVIATPGALTRDQNFFDAALVLDSLAGAANGLNPELAEMIFEGRRKPALKLASAS